MEFSPSALERGGTRIFCTGGIHTQQWINFWKKELKAGELVMNLLENGYPMPLERGPQNTKKGTIIQPDSI
jgi:hypothetical protein